MPLPEPSPPPLSPSPPPPPRSPPPSPPWYTDHDGGIIELSGQSPTIVFGTLESPTCRLALHPSDGRLESTCGFSLPAGRRLQEDGVGDTIAALQVENALLKDKVELLEAKFEAKFATPQLVSAAPKPAEKTAKITELLGLGEGISMPAVAAQAAPMAGVDPQGMNVVEQINAIYAQLF